MSGSSPDADRANVRDSVSLNVRRGSGSPSASDRAAEATVEDAAQVTVVLVSLAATAALTQAQDASHGQSPQEPQLEKLDAALLGLVQGQQTEGKPSGKS